MKSIVTAIILLFPFGLMAQVEFNGYKIKMIKDAEAKAVQDQGRTGTCWSFSTLSFLETEVQRMKEIDVKLSEMWIVRHTYLEKARRYVRFHGNVNFDAGGAFHDATAIIDKYGIVPQEYYPGLEYGTEEHNHSELNKALQGLCDAIIKNPNGKLSTAWFAAVEGVIDAYLGEPIKDFRFNGATYTPKSFAEYLGIDGDNYVVLTSFEHQPMYEDFVIELPDNWMHETAYNIPFEEFKDLFTEVLDKGYTIAWAADVSEAGFQHRQGVAVIPEGGFEGVNRREVADYVANPMEQEEITPDMRQEAYDNYETTDDHGMHISGYGREKNGDIYFKVKNSWGDESNESGGYLYASYAYVYLKTVDIMVHKDALPKKMRKQLDLD